MAHCVGVPLRSILSWAVTRYKKELERRTGITIDQAASMTQTQRRAFAVRYRQIWRSLGHNNDELRERN